MIGSNTERAKAMAGVAADAARAGEVETVKKALGQISDNVMRDQATLNSARMLARRGLRKQAIEIAKTISGNTVRDTALSELAH